MPEPPDGLETVEGDGWIVAIDDEGMVHAFWEKDHWDYVEGEPYHISGLED